MFLVNVLAVLLFSTSGELAEVAPVFINESVKNFGYDHKGNNFAYIEKLRNLVTSPVSLVEFRAKEVSGQLQLLWGISSEKNNSHFLVLRSRNKRDFAIIGEIKGRGTSSKRNYYSFTDKEPLPGGNYYKLEQVDMDGRSTQSAIVFVDYSLNKAALGVFNTGKDKLSMVIRSGSAAVVPLYVSNVNGRVLYKEDVKIAEGKNEALVEYLNSNLASSLFLPGLMVDG